MLATEHAETMRRRGRLLMSRIMAMYVQEARSLQFLTQGPETRCREAMQHFHAVLSEASLLGSIGVHCSPAPMPRLQQPKGPACTYVFGQLASASFRYQRAARVNKKNI